ncbi:hypothetical protein [Streptomyces sp. NPDC001492]
MAPFVLSRARARAVTRGPASLAAGPQNAAQRPDLKPGMRDCVALEPEPDHIAVRPDGSE